MKEITLSEIQILAGKEEKAFLKHLIKAQVEYLLKENPELLQDLIIWGYSPVAQDVIEQVLEKFKVDGLIRGLSFSPEILCYCTRNQFLKCKNWRELQFCSPWRYKTKGDH